MIHPGKFGGIPAAGSRDIVDIRICHADADMDADSNGIHTETNMSPLTFGGVGLGGGGHKYVLQKTNEFMIAHFQSSPQILQFFCC